MYDTTRSEDRQIKNRPRYSRDGATRADVQLCQKSGQRALEAVILFVGAIGANVDGLAVIHAEHAHKAFGIDQSLTVANQNAEGLHRGNFNEFLHIPEGLQHDIELLQGICPPVLYKLQNVLYNVG